jgi:uncharacterized membrane protein
MALERRLQRWTEAGLLDAQQAQRILEFEQGQRRPTLLYAVAGLGGLAIALGIISIVAANWDIIPGRLKIATDLTILLASGIVYARFSAAWPLWLREAALLVLYGLAMGSIALAGQVYQLGGTARDAMTVWSILTAPLMALGSSAFIALVWLAGLQSNFAAWMFWLSEPPLDADGWAIVGTTLLPWLFLLLGDAAWLRRLRPNYAAMFATVGWAELVLCASIGTNALYENTRREAWNALWVGLAIAMLMVAWQWARLRSVQGGGMTCALLAACSLLTYVPARVSPGDCGLLAALLFIGLWLLVAFAAHSARLYRILNLATAVIGVRIVVVYFEVFGSLLSTGFGLVTGGGLTLLLVWLWWRTRRGFREERSI